MEPSIIDSLCRKQEILEVSVEPSIIDSLGRKQEILEVSVEPSIIDSLGRKQENLNSFGGAKSDGQYRQEARETEQSRRSQV